MKHLFTFIVLCVCFWSYGQNVGIGTKNPQNKLHIAGGLRIDSLANRKDSGVILHNNFGDVYSLKLTGKKSDVLRGDGTFTANAAPTDAWLLGGNAGTDSSNFLGTTDNQPLLIRVNNQPYGILDRNIQLGFGFYTFGSGQDNIALGRGVMNVANDRQPSSSYTASRNIAIGANALASNLTGNNNVTIGYSAQEKGAGSQNVVIGSGAGYGVDGEANTVLGAGALFGWSPDFGSSHFYNVAVGAGALAYLTHGGNNVAVGYQALARNQSVSLTTAIGNQSQFNIENGEGNVTVGAYSMYNSLYGLGNTAVGYAALMGGQGTDVAYCVAIGYQALFSNTSGFANCATGYGVMLGNTSGSYNVANGSEAMHANTSGSYHTATGYQALHSNTTGIYNTAAGSNSLFKNTTGRYNVSTGSQNLYYNTTGSYNSGSGYKALFTNTTGSNNTASGFKALNFNSTGSNNTADGWQALNTNTTGNYNTALGVRADVTTGNLTNATAIGYNAKVNASNKVRIGNAAITKIEGQVPFTTPSDGRYKFNVKEDVKGLEFIMKLRPVTYQFDVKRFDMVTPAANKDEAYETAASIRRTGFIAQEVETAAAASNYNFSGIDKPASAADHYSLSYESFVVPLVKAVQEQQQIIDQQNTIIRQQNQKMDEMLKRLEKLEKKQLQKHGI